ncbi:MAG: DUF1805 domain-containing protein [Archaeoglobales archaeon]|nr:DUF1805 domain-containing protein [Archaeoglobales archaeon]
MELIEIGGKKALGLKVELPNAPFLLMIFGELVIGCGYISIEAMEKLGNCACVVKGVRSFEDMLNAEIAGLTSKAEKLGARKGMRVSEFLERIEI